MQSILHQTCQRGLGLALFDENNLIGFLKAYTSEFRRQAHIFANFTIMMDPTIKTNGHGAKLSLTYRDEILKSFHHVFLFETVPHASNIDAIRFNEKAGFVLQARLPNKIWHTDGSFGDQLVMHQINPNFSKEALLEYHAYLKKALHHSQNGF